MADLAATIEDDGYIVVPEVLDGQTLDAIKAELAPHLEAGPTGRNNFEGHATNRVYALLGKVPSVASLVENPLVLDVLDRMLEPNYLLSANLAINLHPGETEQPWHHDDSFYPISRPRPAISISTIWAIDDFTSRNGATEVIPGSHIWADDKRPGTTDVGTVVEMPKGSVVIFAGTLWHRGGANRSQAPRLGITIQYCQPWARQQEAQMLAVGGAAVRYSERIQSLLGYSIHQPFMGHINGLHPGRLLDAEAIEGVERLGERSEALVLPGHGEP